MTEQWVGQTEAEADAHPGVTGNTWPETPDDMRLFLDEHLDRLVRYAARRLRDFDEGEDAVQDVLTRLLAATSPPSVHNVVGYLFRAVNNACIDRLRKRPRLPVSLAEEDAAEVASTLATPAEAALRSEASRRAEELLSLLPEAQAETIRLRVFEGLQLHEIAEATGCGLSTVNTRLRSGFCRLREAVSRNRGNER